MKKTIAVLIVSIMLCNLFASCISCYATGGEKYNEFEEICAVLHQFKIVSENTDENYMKGLSRAEFAVYVARILKLDEYKIQDVRYFKDVPQDHWAVSCINELVERGMLSQPEDEMFYPDRMITYSEACKMLSDITGYGEYARQSGGYPNGYITAAREAKITKGVSESNELTLKNAVIMLFNTLSANLYYVTSVNGDNWTYNKYDDQTILSKYWDIYSITGRVSLSFDYRVADDRILVEDELLICNTADANRFLGNTVRVFYEKKKNDVNGTVIYIGAYKSDDQVIELSTADVSETDSNFILHYFTEERLKTLKIFAGAIVVKNGELLSTNILSELQSVKRGRIKLIDSDSDNQYDIIIADSSQDYIINHIDVKNEIIYAEYGEKYTIDYGNFDVDRKNIIGISGNPITISNLSNDDLISVYKSDNSLIIYQCGNTVTGKVNGITSETPSITVEGKEYKVDDEFWNYYGNEISVDQTYTFKTDQMGYIACQNRINSDQWQVGYIINVSNQEELQNQVKMKMFIPSKGVGIYECAKKVKIDGQIRKDEEILTAISTNNGNCYAQLVLFTVNSEKCINKIDTAYINQFYENDNSLSLINSLNEYEYGYSAKMFGEKCIINSKTLLIGVPEDENVTDAGEDQFAVLSTKFFKSGAKYNVESYKFNLDNAYDDVVVYKGSLNSPITSETDLFLVDNITTSLVDGCAVETIHGAYKGDIVKFHATPDYSFVNEGIGSGDIIRLALTNEGYVYDVEIMYDYSKKTTLQHRLLYTSFFYTVRFTFGNVCSKNQNVIRIGYNNFDNYNEVMDIANRYIMVYDNNLKYNKVYIGNINDITAYEDTHSAASTVYGETLSGKLSCLIVYK